METIEWDKLLSHTGEVLVAILIILSPYFVALFFYLLGKMNILFTLVEEGQAKAVLVSGQFRKMLMSYRGFRFRRNTESESPATDPLYDPNDPTGTYWDIIQGEDWVHRVAGQIPLIGNLVGGLRWIGIPPLAQLHKYRFEWVTLDYPRSEDGKRIISSEMVPTPYKEDEAERILVQLYTYFAQLKSAETKLKMKGPDERDLGIPVDVDLLLHITIVNPYKALFRSKHWLQTVTNRVIAVVRRFVATKEIEELIDDKDGELLVAGSITGELMERLAPLLKTLEKKFGVRIDPIEIQSIEPAGSHKEEYRKQSTARWTAQQAAKARAAEGEAEKEFIKNTVGTVADIKGGAEIYKWLRMPETRLTTYVESGANVGVNLDTGGNQPPTTPAPGPTSPPSPPTTTP